MASRANIDVDNKLQRTTDVDGAPCRLHQLPFELLLIVFLYLYDPMDCMAFAFASPRLGLALQSDPSTRRWPRPLVLVALKLLPTRTSAKRLGKRVRVPIRDLRIYARESRPFAYATDVGLQWLAKWSRSSHLYVASSGHRRAPFIVVVASMTIRDKWYLSESHALVRIDYWDGCVEHYDGVKGREVLYRRERADGTVEHWCGPPSRKRMFALDTPGGVRVWRRSK